MQQSTARDQRRKIERLIHDGTTTVNLQTSAGETPTLALPYSKVTSQTFFYPDRTTEDENHIIFNIGMMMHLVASYGRLVRIPMAFLQILFEPNVIFPYLLVDHFRFSIHIVYLAVVPLSGTFYSVAALSPLSVRNIGQYIPDCYTERY